VKEVRCPACRRFLLKYAPSPAALIQVRCRDCKSLVEVAGQAIRITSEDRNLTKRAS
jgi:phage FluMu protein Com